MAIAMRIDDTRNDYIDTRDDYIDRAINYENFLAVLTRHHMSGAPVHVVPIANEIGLEVYRIKTLPQGYSGMIRREEGDRYAIYVNADHPESRRRFTIAHEIAHYVLHKNLIGDGIFDDALYRSGFSNKVEWEANSLAADILMPYELIQQAIESSGGKVNTSSLAAKFNVSEQAMSIRLAENASYEFSTA